MSKIKILLVQTVNNNLGDPIIADNNEYLIKKAFKEIGKECTVLRYSIATQDYKQLEYVDAVIFAGGIIKSQTERFWYHFSKIIEHANKLDLPVMLSAVGAEPYENTEEALILKNALNLPCVKVISVRDDINSLKSGWIDGSVADIIKTIDPAIWCPFTYDIVPSGGKNLSLGAAPSINSEASPSKALTTENKSKKLVGLGVIRHKIFENYGHPEIDRQFQLDFWKNTAQLLEKEGYNWTLFTNGAMPDEAFAREVLAYIGYGSLMPTPVNNKALVENINMLDLVIACRMHSNIIAYSLGIPSIGICWNQKLIYWGDRTGYPERMVSIEDMNPEYILNCMKKAEEEGIHDVYFEQYNSVYDAIKEFVSYLTERPGKVTDVLPVTEKLTAFGLGSIERKNSISNSKEAFEFSYDKGFRNFKADIRLTTDKIPVCINKWEKETLKSMSYEIEKKSKKLSFDEFMSLKWYDRFSPMSFRNLLDEAKNHSYNEKISLILDIGNPGEEDARSMFNAIKKILSDDLPSNTDIYFKLEQESLIDIMNELGLDYPIIYLMPDTGQSKLSSKQKDTLYMCKIKNIKYLAIKPSTYNDAVKQAVRENDFKVYLISEEKAGNIIDNLDDENVAFIGSIRYEADHISSLIGE